jgi:DNA-binding transcriptional ArsR family regulator
MLPEVGVPQPTLSRHLALLKSHGLIEDEREGTMVFYAISDRNALEVMRAAGLPCACGESTKKPKGKAR